MTSVEVAAEAVENEEQRIRQAIDAFAQGVRSMDIEAIMACYAPDLVAFDMIPPLKFVGKESYRKSWEQGLTMMEGPITFELRDLHLSVGRDVAFGHSLNRMAFTSKDGEQGGWMRWTGGFQKIKGKWLVAHEHLSVPFDMNTGKALWDLTP